MKPGAEYNPDKTSPQTPSHTAPRIFLAAGAAGSLPIDFLDVPGAYTRADADPSCRQTMRQLPRSDGSIKHPGCVLVMQKVMTGARTPATYGNNIVKRILSNLGGPYWRTSHLRIALTMDHTGLFYYATLTIYHCRPALSSTSTRSANNWNERGMSQDSSYFQVPASNTWA
jgi:hypothetical protein